MELNSSSHMAVWSNQSSFSEDVYLATPSVFIQQVYVQNQPVNLEKNLQVETAKNAESMVLKSTESRVVEA